mmetsp:Transcript_29941/g.114974  ORF Transcript_29941/g.114974 Transcript_29941/m.114974 type:complete len:91 (+) Transcript_29941:112-384(+)
MSGMIRVALSRGMPTRAMMSRVGCGRLGSMVTVEKQICEKGMFLRAFHSSRIWSLEMAEVEERVMNVMKNFESVSAFWSFRERWGVECAS